MNNVIHAISIGYIYLAKRVEGKKILVLSERKTNIENKTLIRINSISILRSLLE